MGILGETLGPIRFDGVSGGWDRGTDEGVVLIILNEVGQIRLYEHIPRSDQMRGRLGSIAAAMLLAAQEDSVFRPGFSQSYDTGSLDRQRELKRQDREAHREERLARAEARRRDRAAKRRQSWKGGGNGR